MKLKESVKNVIAITIFYILIIGGVVLLNARFENLDQQKSAIESEVHIAQNN